MSNLLDLQITREVLQHLAEVVRSTRKILAEIGRQMDRAGWSLAGGQQRQLSDTLEHVEEVRVGFILSQRTSPRTSLAELQALVRSVLHNWNWLESLNLTLSLDDEIELPAQQLVAYNHALVALAVLPRMPAQAITFPQRQPSYADLATPSAPTEILGRIEEIERVVYQAGTLPFSRLAYHPFRRTYAFFEASTWLVNNHLRAILGS
jgi:hypothetical protein